MCVRIAEIRVRFQARELTVISTTRQSEAANLAQKDSINCLLLSKLDGATF